MTARGHYTHEKYVPLFSRKIYFISVFGVKLVFNPYRQTVPNGFTEVYYTDTKQSCQKIGYQVTCQSYLNSVNLSLVTADYKTSTKAELCFIKRLSLLCIILI